MCSSSGSLTAFRQTQRVKRTTVEEPFADVTIGVINAVTEIGEVAGRKLVDEDGRIIQPAGTDADGNPLVATSTSPQVPRVGDCR